jgi:hypothetical protein
MTRLKDDPNMQRRMIAAGLAWSARFTWKAAAAATSEVLEEAGAGYEPGPRAPAASR